eukprot:350946-Chlamydomonas_euryale.AAC.7
MDTACQRSPCFPGPRPQDPPAPVHRPRAKTAIPCVCTHPPLPLSPHPPQLWVHACGCSPSSLFLPLPLAAPSSSSTQQAIDTAARRCCCVCWCFDADGPRRPLSPRHMRSPLPHMAACRHTDNLHAGTPARLHAAHLHACTPAH